MPKQHAIERARSSAKPPTLARLAKLINQEHHAACRAFEKTVDHSHFLVGSFVGNELGNLFSRRQRAANVNRCAANERIVIGRSRRTNAKLFPLCK